MFSTRKLHIVLFAYTTFCINTICGVKVGNLEYFDLSYSMSEETIFYPGQKEFKLFKDYFGWNTNYNYWYTAFSFCMGEHGGTHLDSPYHYYNSGLTVEQIPLKYLIDVKGSIINIEDKVNNASDPSAYLLTVTDIINHEEKFGRIDELVFVYTGWSKLWPNRLTYLGWDNQTTNEDGSVNVKLNFPGVSEDAAKWLFNERQILGIGIDTASVDQGKSKTLSAHVFLAKNQVYVLENVANLHLILNKSCSFFILPMKIVGGSGSPTRILAKCLV